jgi:hypothetical protein
MKRHLTSIAAVAVLADVVFISTAWHLAPALSLTAALAVPAAETLLAPLYVEPVREAVAFDGDGGALQAQLYRPPRAQRSLVLVRDRPRTEDGIASLARALARRGVVVVVPDSASADLAMLRAYTKTFRGPTAMAAVSTFDEGEGTRSPLTRAAHAWRLFRLSRALLSPR